MRALVWIVGLVGLAILLYNSTVKLLITWQLARRAMLLRSFRGYWGDYGTHCVGGKWSTVFSFAVALVLFLGLVPAIGVLRLLDHSRWGRMRSLLSEPAYLEGLAIVLREAHDKESFERGFERAVDHIASGGVPREDAEIGLTLLMQRMAEAQEEAAESSVNDTAVSG